MTRLGLKNKIQWIYYYGQTNEWRSLHKLPNDDQKNVFNLLLVFPQIHVTVFYFLGKVRFCSSTQPTCLYQFVTISHISFWYVEEALKKSMRKSCVLCSIGLNSLMVTKEPHHVVMNTFQMMWSARSLHPTDNLIDAAFSHFSTNLLIDQIGPGFLHLLFFTSQQR